MKKLLLFFCLLDIFILSMDEERIANQSGIKRKSETFFCQLCKDSLRADKEINLRFNLENTHFICTECNQYYSSSKNAREHFLEEHVTNDMIQPMKKKHRKD